MVSKSSIISKTATYFMKNIATLPKKLLNRTPGGFLKNCKLKRTREIFERV